MTKPPNGTVPFDFSDLISFKKKQETTTEEAQVSSVNPATRAPPPCPLSKEMYRGGGTA